MRKLFYPVLVFVTGAVISIMVVFNTEFGVATTMGVSLMVNQAVGIFVITMIMWGGRHNRKFNPQRKKSPWWLWFGGLFGFAILNLNYVTIVNIGASLAMATAVFGQSLSALVFDLTGLLGMPKVGLDRRKLLALAVSASGIVVMAFSGGTFAIPYILFGTLAGILTMTQMVYNGLFASYKGELFSARQNVVGALVFAMVFYAAFEPRQTLDGLRTMVSVPWYLVIGGGSLAVFVVVSCNFVIPKIPAIYSALLMSSGQILMSVAIDKVFYGEFSAQLFIGALLILAGMIGNLFIDLRRRDRIPDVG
ncbi:MAG: DMT family transporter [Sphaerochaetaceae bacterium]|nr:DMT family transporter [Sphaerochaetaceae bacterium]